MNKPAIYSIPDWAINYLFNGVEDFLEDEDENALRKFLKGRDVLISFVECDGVCDPYFTWHPAIGNVGSMCYDCSVIFVRRRKEK
jgi:hypothetical protein